ncbi:Energy transducer, TonB [Bradyrhizobium sp. ORS 285]|uniref:TonB family protein n=1 Tax=Bradyrhizobium sp. ORS 285 TaxID=115808 RepID=UPI00024061EA|nr:TonB family protein [Bradyrhizobium sp. ORS 285]CCD87156.1 Energy transducer, TonB [Bradyrhizobium sp. ORS 285]SMX60184.1 Energy transducer, TonB [Bradyrhizobium sp. ORS 285]
MSVLTLDPYENEDRRERALWTTAALVVAGLHVGLAVGYLLLRPAPQGRAEAPAFDVVFTPAVVSEPAPAIQDAPQAEPTPKDEPAKDEPVAREAVAEPVPQPSSEPEPQVMAQPVPVPEVTPTPEPAPQVALAPEPPRADDVVLPPPPPPKPIEAKPPEAKPAPERVEHKPPERKVEKKPAPPKQVAALPSRPARSAAAPNAGADSEGARQGRASWNSEFIAHFRRYNTTASGGKEGGTVSVSAVIARNGRLVSRRIASSSGSATVDRAALELVDRAQPFPPFPAEMTQAQTSLVIPIRIRPQ